METGQCWRANIISNCSDWVWRQSRSSTSRNSPWDSINSSDPSCLELEATLMRREPGTSSPQGEIRDVLASSSCVISQICEYEMTLPGNWKPFKIQTRSKFAAQSERERRAWLSLAATWRTWDKRVLSGLSLPLLPPLLLPAARHQTAWQIHVRSALSEADFHKELRYRAAELWMRLGDTKGRSDKAV